MKTNLTPSSAAFAIPGGERRGRRFSLAAWLAALLALGGATFGSAQTTAEADTVESASGTVVVGGFSAVSDDAADDAGVQVTTVKKRKAAVAQAAAAADKARVAVAEARQRINAKSFDWAFAGNAAAPSLTIAQTKPMDSQAKAELTEDVAVMARILDKAVGASDGKAKAMNVHIRMLGGSPGLRQLYLDGYGLVFLIETGVPLRAVVADKVEKKPANTSPDWEEAKQEVYGTASSGAVIIGQDADTGEEYDPDRVEELKTAVLEALKNGTHVRRLKAGDRLVVVVRNGGGGNRSMQTIAFAGGMGGSQVHTLTSKGGVDNDASSSLTFTALKEDIDAFASGKLSLDDFRKKVVVVGD